MAFSVSFRVTIPISPSRKLALELQLSKGLPRVRTSMIVLPRIVVEDWSDGEPSCLPLQPSLPRAAVEGFLNPVSAIGAKPAACLSFDRDVLIEAAVAKKTAFLLDRLKAN